VAASAAIPTDLSSYFHVELTPGYDMYWRTSLLGNATSVVVVVCLGRRLLRTGLHPAPPLWPCLYLSLSLSLSHTHILAHMHTYTSLSLCVQVARPGGAVGG
jgi:hypothetical protein